MKKRILILSGGGSKVACIVGYIYGLWKNGKFDPTGYDVIIAGSAGAPVACYIATGQIEELYQLWFQKIPNVKAVRFPYYRSYTPNCFLEHLKDGGDFELSVERLHESLTQVVVPARNINVQSESGSLTYFVVNKSEYLWDILCATASVPLITKKLMKLDGDTYSDSIEVSHPNAHLMYALMNYDCESITILNCLQGDGICYQKNDKRLRVIERRVLGFKHKPLVRVEDLDTSLDIISYNLRPIKGTQFWNTKKVLENLSLYKIETERFSCIL